MVRKPRAPFMPPDIRLWNTFKNWFGADMGSAGLIRYTGDLEFKGQLEFHGVDVTPEMISLLSQLTPEMLDTLKTLTQMTAAKSAPETPVIECSGGIIEDDEIPFYEPTPKKKKGQ